MSAVEDYTKHRDMMYKRGYRDSLKYADAAIAELEAERDAWKEQRDAEHEAWADEFRKREQAEAELAAEKDKSERLVVAATMALGGSRETVDEMLQEWREARP